MTSHSVGGSSSTGAKLLERTCFGSTEGLRGGSMKLLMMVSNELKIKAGRDCSVGGGGLLLITTLLEEAASNSDDEVLWVVEGGGEGRVTAAGGVG